jgi:hypothetical protein
MADGVPLVVEGEMVKIIDSVSVQHAKLKVDTRKWLMSKMKPKKYGDRTTTEHTGSLKISDLSESELDGKLLQLEQLLEQSAKT